MKREGVPVFHIGAGSRVSARTLTPASVWRSRIQLAARPFLVRARPRQPCRADDRLRPASDVGWGYWDPLPGHAEGREPPAPSLPFFPGPFPSGYTDRKSVV